MACLNPRMDFPQKWKSGGTTSFLLKLSKKPGLQHKKTPRINFPWKGNTWNPWWKAVLMKEHPSFFVKPPFLKLSLRVPMEMYPPLRTSPLFTDSFCLNFRVVLKQGFRLKIHWSTEGPYDEWGWGGRVVFHKVFHCKFIYRWTCCLFLYSFVQTSSVHCPFFCSNQYSILTRYESVWILVLVCMYMQDVWVCVCTCVYVCACMWMCVCPCMCARMHACVRACMRVCVCVHVCVCCKRYIRKWWSSLCNVQNTGLPSSRLSSDSISPQFDLL